jgi:urease accessory protein
LPETANPLLHGHSFILATAILHLLGIGFGLLLRYRSGQALVRLGGGAIAAAGALLLGGA